MLEGAHLEGFTGDGSAVLTWTVAPTAFDALCAMDDAELEDDQVDDCAPDQRIYGGGGGGSMSEFWIVSGARHEEHETLVDAVRERDALRAHFPDKTFKIFRCKRFINSARHFPKLVALLQDITRDGLTPANRDRASILLGTIAVRNETPHLKVNRSIPEFDPRAVRR